MFERSFNFSTFDEPSKQTETGRSEDDVEDQHELQEVANLAQRRTVEEQPRRDDGAAQA